MNNKNKLNRVLLFLSAIVLLGFAKTDVCAAKSYDSVKNICKGPGGGHQNLLCHR